MPKQIFQRPAPVRRTDNRFSGKGHQPVPQPLKKKDKPPALPDAGPTRPQDWLPVEKS